MASEKPPFIAGFDAETELTLHDLTLLFEKDSACTLYSKHDVMEKTISYDENNGNKKDEVKKYVSWLHFKEPFEDKSKISRIFLCGDVDFIYVFNRHDHPKCIGSVWFRISNPDKNALYSYIKNIEPYCWWISITDYTNIPGKEVYYNRVVTQGGITTIYNIDFIGNYGEFTIIDVPLT